MKKLLFLIFLGFIFFCVKSYANPIEYTVIDSTNSRGTHILNGDLKLYKSTPTATSNFEVVSGSITKCSSIKFSDGSVASSTAPFTPTNLLSSTNTWSAPQTFNQTVTAGGGYVSVKTGVYLSSGGQSGIFYCASCGKAYLIAEAVGAADSSVHAVYEFITDAGGQIKASNTKFSHNAHMDYVSDLIVLHNDEAIADTFSITIVVFPCN